MLKQRGLYHDVLFCIAISLGLHLLVAIIDDGGFGHFLQCRLKSFAHMQGLKWSIKRSVLGDMMRNRLDCNSCVVC